MNRFSVTGVDKQSVVLVGAVDVRAFESTGVTFASLTDDQVEELKGIGAIVVPVQAVEAEVSITRPEVKGRESYAPEELASLAGIDSLRSMTSPGLNGFGVNIAVIDTGVRETHELVSGHVVMSKNYVKGAKGADEDGFDHGTGVASILASLVPGCGIINMRTLNSEGAGTTEEVIEAIEDCINLWNTDPHLAPAVINVSLGSVDLGSPNDPLRVACRAALQNRIWVIAAAGNSGPSLGTIMSPACERYVLAVGSISPVTGEISTFSSRGPTAEGLFKPDVTFFGENVRTASSRGDSAYVVRSGTSFAAPFVSTIGALYLQGKSVFWGTKLLPGTQDQFEVQASIDQVIDSQLNAMCVKPAGMPKGKDCGYGYGVPVGPQVSNMIFGKRGAMNGDSRVIPSVIGSSITAMIVASMLRTFTGVRT